MTRSTRPSGRLVPLGFAHRARRVVRSGDAGATLIYALIFITIAAVALGAILAFADTSMRTTISVRAQAAQAAAADGAAQIAINKLRQGTYTGGACSDVPLSGFYQATNGAGTYSATVTCEQDTADSSGGGGPGSGLTLPDDAILTLGRNSPPEDGVMFDAHGSPNSVTVKGPIFSNSNINVDKLTSTSRVTARGACSPNMTANPLSCNIGNSTNPTGSTDPGYSVPTLPTTAGTVPSCRHGSAKMVAFSPGVYSSLKSLNDLTTSCDGVFWFQPGVYLFTYSGQWTIDAGYLVGGTPIGGGTMPDGVPTIPGSCKSPVPPDPPGSWSDPGQGKGVEFVFSGDAQLFIGKGQMEVCGNEAAGTPPIAIYGLSSAVGSVSAQNGCVTTVGGCDFLSSRQFPTNALFVDGTTYAPKAAIDIVLNNRTGQVFGGGVIARHLGVTATASADLTNPIVSLPGNAGPRSTVIYLAVYVCPGTTACNTSGSPQLKVKVGIVDPGGSVPVAGARQVTVYAWSVQR